MAPRRGCLVPTAADIMLVGVNENMIVLLGHGIGTVAG